MNLYNIYTEGELIKTERDKLPDSSFGLPKTRQYPLHDIEHIRKAIQMFGHCPEKNRKELAENIYKAAKKFSVEISEKSLVYKYLTKDQQNDVNKQKAMQESNPFLNFVDFYQLPLNEENIEKYEKYYPNLSVLSEKKDNKGLILVDKYDQIAGFIQVDTKTGYLKNIEVNGIYVNQGIGSKLLNTDTGKLAGIASIKANDTRLLNFFKKNDFVVVSESESSILMKRKSIVNEDSGFILSGNTLTMDNIMDEKLDEVIDEMESSDDIVTRIESYLNSLNETSVAGVASVAPLASQTIRKPFLTDTIYPSVAGNREECPNMFDYDEFYEVEESNLTCNEANKLDVTEPVDIAGNVPDRSTNSSSTIRKPQAMMEDDNTTDDVGNIVSSGQFKEYYEKREEKLKGCEYIACPECGCTDIVKSIQNTPVFICRSCGKYLGDVPFPSSNEDSGIVGAIIWDIIKFIIKLPFNIGKFIAKKIKNSDSHKIDKAIKEYRKAYDQCLDVSRFSNNFKEISLKKLCEELNVPTHGINKITPTSVVKVTAWYKNKKLISYFIEILENKNSTQYEYILGIVDKEYTKEPTKTLLCAVMEYTTNSYGKYLERLNTILRKRGKKLLEDVALYEDIDATANSDSKVIDYKDQSTDVITGIDRYTNHKDINGCYYIALNANEYEDQYKKS